MNIDRSDKQKGGNSVVLGACKLAHGSPPYNPSRTDLDHGNSCGPRDGSSDQALEESSGDGGQQDVL